MIAACWYDGVIRAAIHAFKYETRTRLDHFLASVLIMPLEHRPLPVDLVAPVPLSVRRQRTRGFNQAELLGRPIAAAGGWAFAPNTLARIRDTAPQFTLNPTARRTNVADAFRVADRDSVAGRRILLVDDVCTTGATLEACAAPLLDAGATGVWGLVVARAMQDTDSPVQGAW